MTRYRNLALLLSLAAAVLLVLAAPRAAAQDGTPGEPQPPGDLSFSLPFAGPPGPTTWLYEQHYGNTTSAYNYGSQWYMYGQGMHFGVDLEAPCGTPVLAIADGVVALIDAKGFGSGPHNALIDHPGTGYASLYGHLMEVPLVRRGQVVRRGEQIGVSGDPDLTCVSRPHLHLEIRSADYQTLYNPLLFIDQNWHMLASIGPVYNAFQQDLDTPYRWMRLEDQPEIHIGGLPLNNYTRPWPPKIELRAPVNPPPYRHLNPLPDDVSVTLTTVNEDAWNINSWWIPGDLDAVYMINAVPGQQTGVFRQSLDGSQRTYIESAPPTQYAPNGLATARYLGGGTMQVMRLDNSAVWQVYLDGYWPAISPDGTRLLWEVLSGEILPGQEGPTVAVWVCNLDGSLSRRVQRLGSGWSMWLDAHRLLLVKPVAYSADMQLYILDIDALQPAPVMLGQFNYPRGIKVAPGGKWIAYYTPFQANPGSSGVYVVRTQPGAEPRKLNFFGAYEWRDDRSLYTLSYDGSQDAHALGYIDVEQGEHRLLTDPDDLPIRVANGDWHVSPDGERIIFVDPDDYALHLLTIDPGE
ncbi:MAG: M23 family metallopeptidase [Anaerolineae bacterium]|nr:M23 family metallopeptidase [Anaerolineae bacterium]